MNRYISFCTSYSLQAFPLSESVLCHFVALLVCECMSYSTIRLYLSAARYHQILESGPDPSLDCWHRLYYVLRGCRRSLPNQVHPSRLPITPAILRFLHSRWSNHHDDYNTVCLWAACCIAFFGFLRCGEFTCSSWQCYTRSVLSLEDVAINSREDPTVVHLTLQQSKTDVFGAGATIHLGRTGNHLCPVSAILAYLARRPPTFGPLFLLHSGHPLSRRMLVSTVRATLSSAGVEVGHINGHSFRIGAATAAAQAGLSDSTIQQLGRRKSSAFTRYLRPTVQSIAGNSEWLLHPICPRFDET